MSKYAIAAQFLYLCPKVTIFHSKFLQKKILNSGSIDLELLREFEVYMIMPRVCLIF